jgi:hypothetical protein
LKTGLKTIKKFIALLTVLFLSFNLKAALCTNAASGDWTTAANWSCGHVPACGDSIVIKAGTTITISTQQDYTGCGTGPVIVIYGTLHFVTGDKLRLPCNSRIYLMPGGSVTAGGGGGNSNTIEICSDILWNAADGTLSGPTCLPPTASWCMSVVLPVELVNFKGEAKDGYVDLAWSTATERNSSHFEIERSADASAFEKVGSVNSKAVNGNSNALINYSATDDLPVGKIIYYRLKQVDRDNTFDYSGIISINYIKAKNLKFIVYPNPNKGEFTADISGLENNHEVTINMKDEKGRVVYTSSFYMQEQSSRLNIVPETKLANGIYICTLTLEGIEYNVKVVVN